MSAVNARSLSRLETACCLILGALLLWKGIFPAWQILNTDFPNYYLVARLLREGYSLDRIYDWIWLQRVKDHWGLTQPLVGFAGLTPFSALPMLPLSFFAALTAKRIWIVLNLLLLVGTVEAVNQVTELGRKRIWLLCLLCVLPLRTNFLFGQMHLLILFLLVLAYVFDRNEQPLLCGICLSIAGLLKVYPFLFAAYFLWKRQWTALLGMLGATIILLGLSGWVFDPQPLRIYLFEILPRSLTGEVLDPYNAQSNSVAALFHKLFIFEPQLNPSPAFHSPALYALFYPAWQVAVLLPLFALVAPSKDDRELKPLEWATWVFTLLLLSPVPSSYHFVVMALSMALLADVLLRRGETRLLALALGMYCLIAYLPAWLASSPFTVLQFSRLWVAIAFEILLFYYLFRERLRHGVHRAPLRLAWLGGAACVLWIAGAAGYHRHFAALERDMAMRILPPQPSYLSTGVQATGNGYVLIAMQAKGYGVVDEAGKVLEQGPDQLSVAATPLSSNLLVETATSRGSSLEFLPASSSAQTLAPLVEDAESPALSADEQTMMFIRETKGRGSLWQATLATPSKMLVKDPVKLTGNEYDVHSFALAQSGSVVFAASLAEKTSLFQLTPGKAPQRLIIDLEDVADPALGIDDQRIAFAAKVDHRWQLAFFDRKTGAGKILTSGDCNHAGPAWMDTHHIMFTTDCGRGLGLTALASIAIE